DSLPSTCEVASLGVHTLRDFDRPQEIFQLSPVGMPRYFPPLPDAVVPGASVSERTAEPALRVSDGDRERVVGILREHCTRGYLTLDEFSQRVGLVYGARLQ